ncbi:hypothetical protein NHX12_027481 [Muraenolepis orangiensis]|uniref:Uncharacterized protein n=1 Tax=Muraenolepis orangiensis TaxID=630683 RepID=A0A9Q0EDP1_9TELE|nr:hypothetical protein NHX12_027481 [Muraenolepis orangiensis]
MCVSSLSLVLVAVGTMECTEQQSLIQEIPKSLVQPTQCLMDCTALTFTNKLQLGDNLNIRLKDSTEEQHGTPSFPLVLICSWLPDGDQEGGALQHTVPREGFPSDPDAEYQPCFQGIWRRQVDQRDLIAEASVDSKHGGTVVWSQRAHDGPRRLHLQVLGRGHRRIHGHHHKRSLEMLPDNAL